MNGAGAFSKQNRGSRFHKRRNKMRPRSAKIGQVIYFLVPDRLVIVRCPPGSKIERFSFNSMEELLTDWSIVELLSNPPVEHPREVCDFNSQTENLQF